MEILILILLVVIGLAGITFRRSPDITLASNGLATLLLYIALVLLGIYICLWLPRILSLLLARPAPTLPASPLMGHPQAYIAEIQHLDFSCTPLHGQPRSAAAREFINCAPGTLLQTGTGQSGYVFVGLPGRAELFLGPETGLRFVSSDSTGTVLQLEQGRIILNLREDFPAGRRVTVLSAGGARTWLDGSKMCLSYDAAAEALHLDCVEDRCGYLDNGEQFIQAGNHVTFDGSEVVDAGAGLQPEACQFVPGAVPSSTSTPTSVSTASPTELTPRAATATP